MLDSAGEQVVAGDNDMTQVTRPFRCRLLSVQLISLTIVACGGSGEGLDISGRPISEGGNLPLEPTLASIQANVFNPFCITCHTGAAAPQGLRLDSGISFANLVGVPSREASSLLRVAPGMPDQSYLIHKLEGSAQVGEQMPLGGPPIQQATIDFVRQWIIEGALPEPGPDPDTPPVVVALTPDPDGIVSTLPLQILASFDQDIDASTINAMTFELIRSGGDDLFGNGNEETVLPASVGLSAVNSQLAVMDLTGVVPVEDRYRIILRGDGPNVVLNMNGRALDGEYLGAFPSGDGTDGGDFVVEFDLQGIQPTLQSIQDNVFTPVCAVCHSGPPGPILPAGQDLSSTAASFTSLVGIPSIEEPNIMRVAISDADNSYLIQKLEGSAAVGARMPQGGPFLDQTTVDAIRAWIDSGANP